MQQISQSNPSQRVSSQPILPSPAAGVGVGARLRPADANAGVAVGALERCADAILAVDGHLFP